MKLSVYLITGMIGLLFSPSDNVSGNSQKNQRRMDETKYKKAVFGEGCFWCTEALFTRLKGVKKVVSGYSGGKIANPTYKEVCSGLTGHAECSEITYDPEEITFPELLEVFWSTHDPTTLNRQGNDVGTQYRSVIFYMDEDQKKQAEEYKEKLEKEKIWDKPIVTGIVKFEKFYPAEDYHQEYYEHNSDQSYCRLVITPKIEKFKKVFANKLKK
jgi:peptide-methionine (S)-S-oxide reductase